MVTINIGIYEDEVVPNFYPLTYTKAIFDLRTGIYDLKNRILKNFKNVNEIVFFVRDYLKVLYEHKMKEEFPKYKISVNEIGSHDEELLLVNGRLLFDEKAYDIINRYSEKKEFILVKDGYPVIMKVTPKRVDIVKDYLVKQKTTELVSKLKGEIDVLESKEVTDLKYPWELVVHNAELIKKDFYEITKGRESKGEIEEKVVIYGSEKDIFIEEGVTIEAYTVLNAKNGPIYIGKNTEIQAGARIEGPTYIGEDTIIVGGAQIREGSNIGKVCRVGGEFEESIMHAYSNKYHAGFIGHAYIGEWVNIGAMTTNSDLKDTYGTVKVTIRGKRIDTGLLKVGCFIADMVKTSIGVMIYTGKIIGVASHLHGIVYEDVPSFTIYAKSLGAELVELYLDSVIETQRRMMARRKKELKDYEIEVIRKVYELTEPERREKGVKKAKFKLP